MRPYAQFDCVVLVFWRVVHTCMFVSYLQLLSLLRYIVQ